MGNKNKWDNLSIKDKSNLMQLYINNGVTDLNKIKNLYNEGGDLDDDKQKSKHKIVENNYFWFLDENNPNYFTVEALKKRLEFEYSNVGTSPKTMYYTTKNKDGNESIKFLHTNSFNVVNNTKYDTKQNKDEVPIDDNILNRINYLKDAISRDLNIDFYDITPEIMQEYLENKITSTTEGIQYALDYYNSEGYRERVNKNATKYTDNLQFIDELNNPYKLLNIRPDNMPVEFNPYYDNADASLSFGFNTSGLNFGAHELAHYHPGYNPLNFIGKNQDSQYYGMDYSFIPKDIRDTLKPNKEVNLHDMEINENYSDLVGTRAALFKEGIFDSRLKDNIFNENLLEQYKNSELGKKDRFIQNHSDEQIIKAINDIAYNNKNKNKNIFQNNLV